MIEFATNQKRELPLVQRDVSPTVYLDHWALRKLSEDSARATRFSAALESKNGTLALSWAARDLITIVRDSGFADRFADFANARMRNLEALRNGFAGGSRLRSGRRRLPSDPQIQRGTRFILSELVRALLADKRTKITQNQSIDLIHAVVPVAYCDFVLLDKHWRAQVDGVRARFKEVGMGVPIARVFSERANGVDRFLSELESS